LHKVIEFFGKVSLFGLRVIVDFFRPPFEGVQLVRQIAEAGSKSLPLVIAWCDTARSLRVFPCPPLRRQRKSLGQRPAEVRSQVCRHSDDDRAGLADGHDKGIAGRFGVCGALIITPASLLFQWQREMNEKFREQFEVIRSDVLRANYDMNPWQEPASSRRTPRARAPIFLVVLGKSAKQGE
jgi:hypothetical protein